MVLILIWLDVLAMPTGHARPLPPWLKPQVRAARCAVRNWHYFTCRHFCGVLLAPLSFSLYLQSRGPRSWRLCVRPLGLEKELGAFVAGPTFAASPFKDTISSRLAPLRDFLILSSSSMRGLVSSLGFLVANCGRWAHLGFTLLLKPAIIFGILARSGYSARTSLMSTLPLLPMSEFSFLLAANAMRAGILQPTDAGALTLAGLASFFVSSLCAEIRAEEI